MSERFELAYSRIKEINNEQQVKTEFADYFCSFSSFMLEVISIYQLAESGELYTIPREKKAEINRGIYKELTDGYESSYLNPDYAVKKLGEYGQILSAVYAECRSMVAYAYETDSENILRHMELFLELYGEFSMSYSEGNVPDIKYINEIYSSFAFDYLSFDMESAAKELFVADNGIAGRIFKEADLTKVDYLYDYGEYISDNEIRMVNFINSLSEEDIDKMARTYTEGYRLGFEATGKDLSIKETVEIRYFIGFERVVKRAIELFDELGLKSSIRRSTPSFVNGRKLAKIGYYSSIANKQFECDHEYDKAVYFDRKYMERKLEAYHNALEKYKFEAARFGGPAVIEDFGEEPFGPASKESLIKPDKETRELLAEYNVRSANLVNQYVKGEERSFTIISFPTPAIGEKFEDIFRETIKINTLDYMLYRDMQQRIIDTLDKAKYVRIEGTDGNRTDLTVNLWELSDPDKETKFENCVADVNIPVGEVFTSPKLEGTNGRLHVKNVYLNGLPYKDLCLELKEGMIDKYSCANYDNEDKNLEYIKEHLLFNHESLPIGEFAIGTNVTAYMVTQKYGLESIMPILIAEKTGPHFAMGDTCYSHEEDMMTYNPDGKAIVARENSVSALRHTEPLKAYFGCHTDITIPYNELGRLYGVCEDGSVLDIIRDGRFVLEGVEELNAPFDE